MSWQGQMGTIVRHLINDINPDSYKFSNSRLETTILVAAQLSQMNIDFSNNYTINVEDCTLSPDPTVTSTIDDPFVTLICLRTA